MSLVCCCSLQGVCQCCLYQLVVFVRPPSPLPLSFPSFFLSQFPSLSPLVPPGGLKPSLFPLGPLPCAYSGGGGPAVSSPRYSPSLHQPSLPLTPHSVYSPTVPLLASPQTPQHVPSAALPPPLLAVASSPTVPQTNLASLHAAHPLAVPQAHPNTYFAPYPAQEVAELPVQVNICHSLLASGAICVFVASHAGGGERSVGFTESVQGFCHFGAFQ